MDYSRHVNTRKTPQRERTPGRTDEVENSEGGFVFAVSDWDRLFRFLILGSEGGTFYVGERELTIDNANTVIKLAKNQGVDVVDVIVKVSTDGRAHKNSSALFALAVCAKLGSPEAARAAYQALPKVARTGTHLFEFITYCESLGGWGSGLRRAVARWYNNKSAPQLAYQLLKYRQRNGWSHRDVLRLAHPIPKDEEHKALFDVTCHPDQLKENPTIRAKLPKVYAGYSAINHPIMDMTFRPGDKAKLIRDYGLSWEMLPTEWLNEPEVSEELVRNMPLMATIRQLGRLSANGTLKPMSELTEVVIDRLTNLEVITRSKIHPMHYLLAIKNYSAGRGFRSTSSWRTDGRIIDALDEGFEKSFANVPDSGLSYMIGIDVSSSMGAQISDTNISAAEGAGAIATVIARSARKHYMHGFYGPFGGRYSPSAHVDGFVDLHISAKDSFKSVMSKVSSKNFGSTDCAVPMLYATKNRLKVDVFVVLTDSETWAGDVKPVQALNEYRRLINPNAKTVVVGMTSTGFSIADPNDAGMLDVVGFDAGVLPLIESFATT